MTVSFTQLIFNLDEGQTIPVCIELSGSILARDVIITLGLNSEEGKESKSTYTPYNEATSVFRTLENN